MASLSLSYIQLFAKGNISRSIVNKNLFPILILNKRGFSQEQKKVIEYHKETFPIDIIRLQGTLRPSLREKGKQLEKGRSSFDFCANEEGLMVPVEQDGIFHGPNGMSMRPPDSIVMKQIVGTWRGKFNLFFIPSGTEIPKNTVLIHEHTDLYSLQTTVPIAPAKFASQIGGWLKKFENMSEKEYLEKYPYA